MRTVPKVLQSDRACKSAQKGLELEIMTELGRARAVIVIWTDTSIKSDWVRSEAGRAQADRKLIPVKLEHLTYKDLPPPFDVLVS